MKEAAPIDEGELITDDDKDEVAQYEAWRERELKRIARDRCLPAQTGLLLTPLRAICQVCVHIWACTGM